MYEMFGKVLKPGAVITTACVVELHTLRTIGVRWHEFLSLVKEAWESCMRAEGGFGEVRVALIVMRRANIDGVLQMHVEQTDIPTEMLTWPS